MDYYIRTRAEIPAHLPGQIKALLRNELNRDPDVALTVRRFDELGGGYGILRPRRPGEAQRGFIGSLSNAGELPDHLEPAE